MATQGAWFDFGFDLQPVLSLSGLVWGLEGESVHMDLSFPPSMHTANHHKIFAIQNTHTHTHTLHQHHKPVGFGPIIHGMNQSPLHKKYKQFECVGH